MSAAPMINSLASTSLFGLSKGLAVKSRSLFELAAEIIGLAINIILALNMPTIWAPVLGILLGLSARSILSYLMPGPPHRFVIDRVHFRAIIGFGKWVMLTSLTFYAAIYIDRLFLARAVNMAVLGVYGLARNIADLPIVLVSRLGLLIIFPVIAANRGGIAGTEQEDLARMRRRCLLLLAFGIATVMAWSDRAVMMLYDRRYHEAGWMLFLLLAGSWMGVLSVFSEAAVLGCGKPQFVSYANIIRVTVMIIGLPSGFAAWGLPGAVLALPASECARYSILLISQRRLGIGFPIQDAAASVILSAVLAGWLVVRQSLGLGTPWASLL